ncbi:hypothetical protein [Paenibacillus sp. KN14-4R]|uniref:hypothetical protein n=1 Tax=Paenibacillus sp. KN14-4R TaxID=3445773 RepID=UPI003F9F9CF8
MYLRMPNSKTLHYILEKLAGAGLTLMIVIFFFLFFHGFNWYETFSMDSHNLRWSPITWIAIYGYGLLCSILIDWITSRITNKRSLVRAFLYIGFGSLFFLIQGIHFFVAIIAAGCALIFYLGNVLAREFPKFKYILALAPPLLILLLANLDYTSKKDWKVITTDTSYEAHFKLFNGKHVIPIHLLKGQKITYTLTFPQKNGGGVGHSFQSENSGKIKISELTTYSDANQGDTSMLRRSVDIPADGMYDIVVIGRRLKGSFKVEWEIT